MANQTNPAKSSGANEASLIAVAALCVALNVGLGTLVNLLKAPIYLDAAGTILAAMLFSQMGWRGFALAATVGAASFVISGLLFNPVLFWFVPTQIAIAAYAFFVASRVLRPYFRGRLNKRAIILIVILGIGLGIVAGAVSAPIIALQFGGITGSGPSLIVAVLLKSGENLFNAVLASGLASEPLDKTIQLALAFTLVRITPSKLWRSLGAD